MRSLFGENWHEIEDAEALEKHWASAWILEQGSLTECVRACCRDEFQVKVLCHRFIEAPVFASQALAIDAGTSVLHREVLLCDGESPLVFACSLLPESALVGRYEELRQLGTRPLGHWIFSKPALHREEMLYATLPSDKVLFARLREVETLPDTLIGRKTLFTGASKPFLVSEFFLPALQERQ
ncbi:MAG: chorismate lyase [Gammaproteobacteria bacterium]|nr:chorismate lyase [Gammaproteobacteria bacterium]